MTALALDFDLRDLPSVQHRAGLAGLLFLLENLRSTGVIAPECYSVTSWTLHLNLEEETLRMLFALLYQQAVVERRTSVKPVSGEYDEVLVESGGGTTRKVYAYKDERPAGAWLSESGLGEEWLGLWQDAVWYILRDKAASRGIYENLGQRAADELWKALGKVRDGQRTRLEISSPLFMTARSKSSEGVPFTGEPRHVLLLHFAHALAGAFSLVGLDSRGQREGKGTAWVFSEPRDLTTLVAGMRRYLSSRGPFKSASVMTSAEEAGMAFLSGFETGTLGGAFCVAADKEGHNVHLLAAAHLLADRGQLESYCEVASQLRHYALRRLVIQNINKGRPLTCGVSAMLTRLPPQMGLGESVEGRFLAADCRVMLAADSREWVVELRKLVRSVVQTRALGRSDGLSLDAYEGWQGYPRQRERFYDGWLSSARSLSYDLRRARSDVLLQAVLPRVTPPEAGWRERRDVALLCLTDCSHISPPAKEYPPA